MRCKKIISYFNAYVDDELPENLRRIVDNHLASCKFCQGRLEEIQRINALFHDTLLVPPVPDGLAARIMDEARRRQPVRASRRRLVSTEWNPFGWIAELSVPMRLATCVTVLLAIFAGLSLDGRDIARRNILTEQVKDLYGLEWFAPVPPGSLGSIYISMDRQPYKKRNGQ